MRPGAGSVILGGVLLVTWCAQAAADGGSLRLSTNQGGYHVTVFSAPTPLRAGPVDISVLVQDVTTRAPMPHAAVTVRMKRAGRPALEYAATRASATNKLFREPSSTFPTPGFGKWRFRSTVCTERLW